MKIETIPRLSYRPALDGIRAVAVAAVVAYHLGLESTPGGFLGVDVFFVLSGYLITTLLLLERDATVPGGLLVFDDYGFSTCPGATRAVDEFMASRPEPVIEVPTGQAFVIKR